MVIDEVEPVSAAFRLAKTKVGLDERCDMHHPSDETGTGKGCSTDVLGMATICWKASNEILPATAIVSSWCIGLEQVWFDFRPRVARRLEHRRGPCSTASMLWLFPRIWVSSSSCIPWLVQRRTFPRSTRRRRVVVDGLRVAVSFAPSCVRCVATTTRQEEAWHAFVCHPHVVQSTCTNLSPTTTRNRGGT